MRAEQVEGLGVNSVDKRFLSFPVLENPLNFQGLTRISLYLLLLAPFFIFFHLSVSLSGQVCMHTHNYQLMAVGEVGNWAPVGYFWDSF